MLQSKVALTYVQKKVHTQIGLLTQNEVQQALIGIFKIRNITKYTDFQYRLL